MCNACNHLQYERVVIGIIERNADGAAEHTPYAYLTSYQLRELLECKNEIINEIRLKILNMARSLLVQATHINEYKRFVIAVGRGDVPRLHALVSTALRGGASVDTILRRIQLALNEQYEAKSYTEDEYELEYLFLTLGGRPLAELAHRTLGMPSINTAKEHVATHSIKASPSTPTVDEMLENLDCGFTEGLHREKTRPPIIGAQIMIDEIKVQPSLRYDPATETILGTCRSHSKHCVHEFRTLMQAEAIQKDLEDGTIHLATEGSVVCLGLFDKSPRLYNARPFLVSGTCKTEDLLDQKTMMENCIDAAQKSKLTSDLNVEIWSLATDGDARRRRVFAMLTMTRTVDMASPLGKALGHMPLFDYHCGKNNLTSDCDVKHVMKRYRNAIIRRAGVTIDGVHIPPKDLRDLLLTDPDIKENTVNNLLSATDKQDVTLMYRLLASIAKLKTPSDVTPIEQNKWRIITLLGHVYRHLLEPYTNMDLSLHQQLVHLSALAHLVLALYAAERGRFIPVQLLYDTMQVVKSAFFYVAKTQVANPDGEAWIILLGTDGLEKAFGTVRTICGNDANCDVLQLSHLVF
ncbi:hypothetical protein SISSUDRAFT_995152 [Sistotremastrum suecicum HHB10207 ss-3]|uniref:Uncharacterized protein n=1 Tax=Sistotremastrum suecicum HHB10207 ss-3 TaxID=1314776 RepID=A0A165WQB6_9AGAM|nr:hypothetical protein SISSUDRAFT_995152 [Sistotremastrum suecicum HHB10207 ss-3]